VIVLFAIKNLGRHDQRSSALGLGQIIVRKLTSKT
jgi:hypothetical protein